MTKETAPDITTEADVRHMVDTFYDKVNGDALLSPVFNDHAAVDWSHHLPVMYAFWNSLILGIPGYRGAPFPKHMGLPVSKEHFERWLQLFRANLDEHFAGPSTDLAKVRAGNIAQIFQYKMGLIR